MNDNLQDSAAVNHPPKPAGNYKPWLIHDGMLFISGQTAKEQGAIKYRGKIGETFTLDQGRAAARLCATNLLAQVGQALSNDFNRVRACLKLTVYVNCDLAFDRLPEVADGASDFIVEMLGEKGRHTRVAVGAAMLPGGSSVEIDGLFAIA